MAALVGSVESGLRAALPLATLAIAALVDLLPLPNAGPASIAPSFLLCVFYYWTVERPGLVPPLALFLLAILFDLAASLPLGLTALVLLFVRWVMLAHEDRFLTMSFGLLWLGFALAALVVGLARWLIGSLFLLRLLDPAPLLVEAAMSAAVFPLVVWLMSWLDGALEGEGRASRG
jgi:rod shape-determining protein MreD